MILFIDDEPRIMDSYRRYLEAKLEPSGHQVVFYSNVDQAWEYFEQHLVELELIILDIMMPSGKRFTAEQTNGGLETGLVFYDMVRQLSPKLPVLVFTNFYDEGVEKRFRQDPHCRFRQKANYLLQDFVEEVRAML